MASLIREQAAGIIGRREWWAVADHTAVVAYGSKSCGISITDRNRKDITEEVAENLRKAFGRNISKVSTIDSVLIECSQTDVTSLLAEIENVLSGDIQPSDNSY